MSFREPNHPPPDNSGTQSCTTCTSVPPTAHATVVIGFLVTFRASRVPLCCLLESSNLAELLNLQRYLDTVAPTQPIPNKVKFPIAVRAACQAFIMCGRATRTALAVATFFFILCTSGHLSDSNRHVLGSWNCRLCGKFRLGFQTLSLICHQTCRSL